MLDNAFNLGLWIAIGLGVAIALFFATTFLPVIIMKQWQLVRLHKLCRGKLVLTYDDGPDPLLTPLLLKLLDRYGVKASFYLLGFRAQRSPQMCDRILDAGHELGCHSQMHLHSWRISPWRAIQDVNAGFAALKQWLPVNAPFRPPFGKMTTWTWLALWYRRAPVRWWTVDGCDTQQKLGVPSRVVGEVLANGGGVVLMHNHDRGNERQEFVLSLTEQLLIAALAQGLEITTMEKLYEHIAKAHETAAKKFDRQNDQFNERQSALKQC